jgi:hypothetical protein
MVYSIRNGRFEVPEEIASQTAAIATEIERIVPETSSSFAKIYLLTALASNHIPEEGRTESGQRYNWLSRPHH